jgi:hypothetical protein
MIWNEIEQNRKTRFECMYIKTKNWRRGIVVIASAYRTEDLGLESRQGVRFLGLNTLQCRCQNLKCIVIVFNWEKNASNFFKTKNY